MAASRNSWHQVTEGCDQPRWILESKAMAAERRHGAGGVLFSCVLPSTPAGSGAQSPKRLPEAGRASRGSTRSSTRPGSRTTPAPQRGSSRPICRSSKTRCPRSRAQALAASMVELDVAPTRDGQLVVFHDWTLDCRTEGQGRHDAATRWPRSRRSTWATATPPMAARAFRSAARVWGLIPTLEEYLKAAGRTKLLFNFKSRDPAEADMLAAALKAAGRDPKRAAIASTAARGWLIARIPKSIRAPGSSPRSAKACSKAYALQAGAAWRRAPAEDGTLIVADRLPVGVRRLAQPRDRADGGGRRADPGGRAAAQRRPPDGGSTCPNSSAKCRRASTAISLSTTCGISARRCVPRSNGALTREVDLPEKALERPREAIGPHLARPEGPAAIRASCNAARGCCAVMTSVSASQCPAKAPSK